MIIVLTDSGVILSCFSFGIAVAITKASSSRTLSQDNHYYEKCFSPTSLNSYSAFQLPQVQQLQHIRSGSHPNKFSRWVSVQHFLGPNQWFCYLSASTSKTIEHLQQQDNKCDGRKKGEKKKKIPNTTKIAAFLLVWCVGRRGKGFWSVPDNRREIPLSTSLTYQQTRYNL